MCKEADSAQHETGTPQKEMPALVKQPPLSAAFPIIVVTGLSGAGKSTVLQVFEDMNYFKVDGLPAELLPGMVSVLNHQALSRYKGLVLGMNLRQPGFVRDFHKAMASLFDMGLSPFILYIEAKPDVLVRRYAMTRRPHPLECEGINLETSLMEERKRLDPIRRVSDLTIDTSKFSIHDLRRIIQKRWNRPDKDARLRSLRVNIVSFGFKYGLPVDAEMVFDLRMLPNPYFDPELRSLSGKEPQVAEYVLGSEPGRSFYARLQDFIENTLPLFEQEGRYRLTIGIGCTGGRHRSVAVAEALYTALKKLDYAVSIEHRHMDLG